MTQTLNQNIQQLSALLKAAQNKKILWEEMQIISKKAFEIQDRIMAELDQIETLETDITKIQSAFAARESIWDMMEKITNRELELKKKTYTKETEEERLKRHQEVLSTHDDEESCSCCHHAHHHEHCHCNEHERSSNHEHCCCTTHEGKCHCDEEEISLKQGDHACNHTCCHHQKGK